jgi:hypothetical protein
LRILRGNPGHQALGRKEPEPQRPDRPVLEAAPDLAKFGDIRMLFGQSPQILLQLLR